MREAYEMIVVLGHTAGGKTAAAANVARTFGGAVVSADSRQVYRGMTIGTGKDYDDYIIEGDRIPSYLIDIVDPGYEYNVFEFQKDFYKVYDVLKEQGRLPVLCGGTGMYLEAILRNYEMLNVPVNKDLREALEDKSLEELVEKLRGYRSLHNKTDVDNRKRTVRAIEIEEYQKEHGVQEKVGKEINSLVIGINYERNERRRRITERLKQRLDEGMVEEAKSLLDAGVSHEKLEYYGLEYKYLSLYLRGNLTYKEMFSQLNTAIHQFAKRQMTYFRGMERRGVDIQWIDGRMSLEEKVSKVESLYRAI